MTSGESDNGLNERPRLRAITIRWDHVTHEVIRAEAQHAGVTVAQFVREAALIRACVRGARRDAPGLPIDYIKIAEEIERLANVKKPR